MGMLLKRHKPGYDPGPGPQAGPGPAPADESAGDLSELTRDELQALAEERDIDVERADGEDLPPLKADYLRALE